MSISESSLVLNPAMQQLMQEKEQALAAAEVYKANYNSAVNLLNVIIGCMLLSLTEDCKFKISKNFEEVYFQNQDTHATYIDVADDGSISLFYGEIRNVEGETADNSI